MASPTVSCGKAKHKLPLWNVNKKGLFAKLFYLTGNQ